MITIKIQPARGLDVSALGKGRLKRAAARASRKAGITALRDMRSEASKRVRAQRKLKLKLVNQSLKKQIVNTRRIDRMRWTLGVTGIPVALSEYPHRRNRKGVSVEVQRGKRTQLPGRFTARMKSGHQGIFQRRGKARLPIVELRGSRPVDILLKVGEAAAVARRGRSSYSARWKALFRLELKRR